MCLTQVFRRLFPYFRLKLLIFLFIPPLFPLAWGLRSGDLHSFAAAFFLFQGPRQQFMPCCLRANNKGTKNMQWAELLVHGGRNHQVQEAKLQAKLSVRSLSIKTQLKPLSFALVIQKESTAIHYCCSFWYTSVTQRNIFNWSYFYAAFNKDLCVVKGLWLLH